MTTIENLAAGSLAPRPVVRGRFVAVEGPTGVGKTTLATRLAAALGADLMLDPYEANPFLSELLTGGPAGSPALALCAELTFVALRTAQLRAIAAVLDHGRDVVADWAMFKQPIFAATTLDPADAARVTATVDLWTGSLPVPDLLIGLSAPAAMLRARVRSRGRYMEAGLSDADLAALSDAFGRAYRRWPARLIRRDATAFDSLNDHHLAELADEARQLPTLLESR